MKLLILTQKVDSLDDNLGFFHRWIEAFAARCESVIVICLYEGTHDLPKNVRVLSLGKEGGVSRINYVRRFYSYIWKERKNYDAVFVHMNQIYVILGSMLWRMLNKKVSWWYAHGAVPVSVRLAERLTDVAFTSTPEGFGIPSKKLHIVGQGIDTDLFAPNKGKKKSETVRIVSVGRISTVKHIEILIQAIQIIREHIPEAQLFVYGGSQTKDEKEYEERLKREVVVRNLEDAVFFYGSVLFTDLPDLIGRAHVFAQASQTGSLDKAVLEALALGIPAVSTNNAFKSFPGVIYSSSEPRAFAENVQKALAQESFRDNIVKHHSLPGLIENIMGILSRNLEPRR